MTVDYWITTHYPHPVPDTAPWHVYFRKRPETYPKVGDKVLFYETHQPQADRDRVGRKAVVCAAVVSDGLKPMSGIGPWVHQVPCVDHRWGTPVPLKQARKAVSALFFKQTLTRIGEAQYNAIASKMGVLP
jgi:hypothetical protein